MAYEQIHATLGELVSMTPALNRLAAITNPPQLVYHIVKLIKLIRPEWEQYEEQRMALLKKYGTERQPTEAEAEQMGSAPVYEVKEPTKYTQFAADMKDLLASEVTIAWKPIAFSALSKADVAAADILALDPLLSFEGMEPVTSDTPEADETDKPRKTRK